MTDITLKEYSDYVFREILERFPQLVDYYKFDNDIVTFEYPSPNRIISFWITTQDFEITIGFDNKEGVCLWHIHYSQFGKNFPTVELTKVITLFDKLLLGKILVMKKNKLDYFLVDNIAEEIKQNRFDEILEFYKWDEL